MAVGETLFEHVVGDRIICEREEVSYQSLVAFYALADARFKARWRIVSASHFSKDGEVMVTWERYLEVEEDEEAKA